MARRFWTLALPAILLVACAACKKQPPAAELPPPDAEPTPRAIDIAAEIEKGLQPLQPLLQVQGRSTVIPDLVRTQLTQHLQQANAEHRTSEHGLLGLRMVVNQLETYLTAARGNDNAHLVFFLIDLIRVIEPDNLRSKRYESWATRELERPIVTIKGWFQVRLTEEELAQLPAPELAEEELYVLVELYFPLTGARESLRIREGEEFHGYKFYEIIGKKRGIRLFYEPTNQVVEVFDPSVNPAEYANGQG